MFLPFGFALTPWVKRLIIANAIVFLATALLPLAGYLAFVPMLVLRHPWTVVTYMFVHAGFLHLLFNMIGLFFFGPPLEARWGSREFLRFYLIAGLGGAALSFIFAPQAAVVGASAAVFGVMLAFALNWPDAPIYIWGILPVKAKWLIAIIAAMSLFSAFGGSTDNVAHFAHLGGFAAAWFYLKFDPFGTHAAAKLGIGDSPRRGASRGRGGSGGSGLAGLRDRLRRAAGPRTRIRVLPDDEDRSARRDVTRRRHDDKALDEIDRVLDKISEKGMASLSAEEKRLLDEVSRRYRQN